MDSNMKTIKYLIALLVISQATIFSQTNDSLSVDSDPANYINVDGLLLIFGGVNPGIERRIVDEFCVFGSVGFGSMWFTDIKQMFEIGAKYRLKAMLKNNFYAGLSYYKMSLEYKNKTASASSIGFLFGYYHIFFDWLRFDANGGMYISGDNKVTFTEQSGNLTKSVSIGGVNLGGSLKIGIAF